MALLGDFNLDAVYADGYGRNFLLEPTAFVPPIFLLACQGLVLLFLLSSLIAFLAFSYPKVS